MYLHLRFFYCTPEIPPIKEAVIIIEDLEITPGKLNSAPVKSVIKAIIKITAAANESPSRMPPRFCRRPSTLAPAKQAKQSIIFPTKENTEDGA